MTLLLLPWHRHRLSALRIPIEVLSVRQVAHLRHPWRRHSSLVNHLPVHPVEPFVCLNLTASVPLIAQSQAAISTQEALHELTGFGLNVGRELVVAIHDLLVDAQRVVIVERWVACQHLKDENAERPPIHILVVSFWLDYFRRQILRSSTKRVSFVFDNFCKTEISYLYVTLLINQQVLRLKISVSNIHRVEVVKGKSDFRSEEKCYIVGKTALPPQKRKQLTPTSIVQHHVHMWRCLKSPLQADDERVVNRCKHFLFGLYVVDLFQFNNCWLF